jgi:hypothetical protein
MKELKSLGNRFILLRSVAVLRRDETPERPVAQMALPVVCLHMDTSLPLECNQLGWRNVS